MNNFCVQKKITKTIKIGDEAREVVFYAIPYGTIMKIRSMGKAISRLVATMLSDGSKDRTKETVTRASDKTDANGHPYVDSIITENEMSPSMASLRLKQMQDAIEGLLETLGSDDAVELASEIIVKSARDEFSEADAKELKDKMDLSTMLQFLMGAFEASAEGVAELGKSLFPRLGEKLKEKTSVLNSVL